MSGFWSIRRLSVGAFVLAAAVGATCLLAQTTPAPVSTTSPVTPPNPALAFINGKEVNREAFDGIMLQVSGMRVFQQVYDLTIVQQACVNSGIPMQGKDYTDRIQAEIDRTLSSLTITQPPGAAPLSKEEETKQRQLALGQLLAQRGVTAVEWRMGLDTSAGLREMAKGKITATTDDEAKTAWESQYGERRSVHIMVLPTDDREAAKISGEYRKMITEDKKTPEQAAQELKQGQPASWTISKNATEVPDIYKVTFDVLKKEGEISAITKVTQKDQPTQQVIVMLDKIEADKKTASPFNDTMKADMKKKVYEAKEQQWMNNQLQILRLNATVDIKDPILKDQFDQVAAQMRANAAAATATAPAATTGVAPTASTKPASMPGVGPMTAPAK